MCFYEIGKKEFLYEIKRHYCVASKEELPMDCKIETSFLEFRIIYRYSLTLY